MPRAELRAGLQTLPDILRFGIRVMPGSLADGASAEAGTWILGLFSTVAAVGAWNVAWTMGKRTLDLNIRLAEMLFPTLVQRWADDDRHGFQRALTDSTRYVVTVMLLPAAVAGGAADGVMQVFRPRLLPGERGARPAAAGPGPGDDHDLPYPGAARPRSADARLGALRSPARGDP